MDMETVASLETIAEKIYIVRGQKVMLDRNLAELYEVETRVLKQAVRRNIKRFPDDFMFELTKDEEMSLRSQNVILKRGGHSKYLPFAFTEQGVAMLSTVLKSERAVQVNIQIMRIFIKMRRMIVQHDELQKEMRELRKETDQRFRIVFETLDKLLTIEEKPKRRIGF
jgi:hypothetical protein